VSAGKSRRRPDAATRDADDALVRLRAIAARLVDDDDHDCDLTEELEYACEMAILFQRLDAMLSGGGPRPFCVAIRAEDARTPDEDLTGEPPGLTGRGASPRLGCRDARAREAPRL
jgi:hypothetical protein